MCAWWEVHHQSQGICGMMCGGANSREGRSVAWYESKSRLGSTTGVLGPDGTDSPCLCYTKKKVCRGCCVPLSGLATRSLSFLLISFCHGKQRANNWVRVATTDCYRTGCLYPPSSYVCGPTNLLEIICWSHNDAGSVVVN